MKEEEYADRGVVELAKHIKESGAVSITYGDFCQLIGRVTKDGKPVEVAAGGILGLTGHKMLHFDPDAPQITVLVVGKKTGLPGNGFCEFERNWKNMGKLEKREFCAREKEKVEKYRLTGKVGKFLLIYGSNANASVEFSYQQESDYYTVMDGVSVKKHRDFEYRKRNQTIVLEKKIKSKCICECCGFEFQKKYGILGEKYIECHHIKPLVDSNGGEKIGLEDLAALCSNCHRMIHKLLGSDKEKYQDNYAQSVKDLRRMVKSPKD